MFFYFTLTKTLFLLQIYLIYVIFEKLTYIQYAMQYLNTWMMLLYVDETISL